MLFVRSIPEHCYRRYTAYRPLLRHDFQFRCAYCLTLETHIGGEANFAIDHYRPRRGRFARPDLEAVYSNLYWVCRECNENKGDWWTTPEQEAAGIRWLDPCEPWGDHDLHWHITPDGEIHWLTPIGEFTVKRLRLHQRGWLKRHWRKLHQWQQRRTRLIEMLETREISTEERVLWDQQIAELDDLLNPPVFDRPRQLP
jgi:hypothetical protein